MSYLDQALPFGLHSALADSLAWALHQSEVDYSLHYLDDFSVPQPTPQAALMLWPQQFPVCTTGAPNGARKG